MNLLIQFLLRLSFGLAVGMAITSSRKVTSGYFRNHLYVTLGLCTLAALVGFYLPSEGDIVTQRYQIHAFWLSVTGAIVSYVGSVIWLYEQKALGKLALITLALSCLDGAYSNNLTTRLALLRDTAVANKYPDIRNETSQDGDHDSVQREVAKKKVDLIEYRSNFMSYACAGTSGLLLGITMAAMLLGHWYLNSPTMELVPLRRLILAVGVAVVLQMIVSALGLWGELTYAATYSTQWILFLVLRWAFGLVGVAVLAWMAWETLKVPNTQSATGILYVAVIGTFVGETMALLLSAESLFPL